MQSLFEILPLFTPQIGLVGFQQGGDVMGRKTQNSPERNDSMGEIIGKVGEGMSVNGWMRNLTFSGTQSKTRSYALTELHRVVNVFENKLSRISERRH